MQERSKRIAKNTIVLYFRMVLTMFIHFFTVRVILETLGISDYGIYNVVGGFVGMFSIISGSLSSACTRFLNFAMGKGDMIYLKKVFSTEVSIQVVLSIIVIIVSETLGIWFLNNKMIIPEERLYAANCCFQLSILNFCFGLLQVPYSASVVAHEKMSAFAYMSIYGAFMQLIITYLVYISPVDKLVFYATLLCINTQIVRTIYRVYCRKHFEECSFHFCYDKQLIKEIFTFSGWNFIGASSAVLRGQGNNILLNLFFGPSVNAARAIGNKIHNTATGFVYNFIAAMTPQITQSYSSGDHYYMFKLIYKGTRLAYYMMLFMAIPLIINAPLILNIWLVKVPEEAVLFGQLTFVLTLTTVISNPLVTAQLATGDIKKYQIIVGGLQMLNLPISYICIKMGAIPQSVIIVAIFFEIICLTARIILLKDMIGLNISTYLKEVILNILLVTIVAVPIPIILASVVDNSWLRLLFTSIASFICSSGSILYIGCKKEERLMIISKITNIVNKKTLHI